MLQKSEGKGMKDYNFYLCWFQPIFDKVSIDFDISPCVNRPNIITAIHLSEVGLTRQLTVSGGVLRPWPWHWPWFGKLRHTDTRGRKNPRLPLGLVQSYIMLILATVHVLGCHIQIRLDHLSGKSDMKAWSEFVQEKSRHSQGCLVAVYDARNQNLIIWSITHIR